MFRPFVCKDRATLDLLYAHVVAVVNWGMCWKWHQHCWRAPDFFFTEEERASKDETFWRKLWKYPSILAFTHPTFICSLRWKVKTSLSSAISSSSSGGNTKVFPGQPSSSHRITHSPSPQLENNCDFLSLLLLLHGCWCRVATPKCFSGCADVTVEAWKNQYGGHLN